MVEPHLQLDETCPQPKLKLAKILSSPDKIKRDKAMSLIGIWLTSQKEVKEEELSKIWKGLFYCLRQAAKLPVQETNLIDRVSDLINKLDLDISRMFFEAFLTALASELDAVDASSSDSFYILLTQNVSCVLAVLQIHGWDLTMIRSFMGAVLERSFLSQAGVGMEKVNVHITDIFLTALREFFPIPIEAFTLLLEPFLRALEEGCNKIVAERICAGIFLPICESGCRKLEGQSTDRKDGFLGDIALSLPLLSVVKNILATRESYFVLEGVRKKITDLENMLVSTNVIVMENSLSSTETATSVVVSGMESPSIVLLQQGLKFRKFGCRARRNPKARRTQDTLASKPQDSLEACLPDERPVENYHECVPLGNVCGQARIGEDDNIQVKDSVILNTRETFDSTIPPESSLYTSPLASTPVNTGSRKRKSCGLSSPLDFDNAESPAIIKENNTLSYYESYLNQDAFSKKAKKVHFSLQHNLVWRPSTPLPPHDLRVPPGATPRGSALKKGVPPGPILDLDDSVLVSPRRKKKAATRKRKSKKGNGKGSKRVKKSPVSSR